MSDACKQWGIPVISGNVSFYNESFGQPIYPTPTVGLVGLIEDVSVTATVGFKNQGDVIVLVGETYDELGGSEYLKVVHGKVAGRPPALDLELEAAVQAAVREAVRSGLAKSTHDCSEGGMVVTLAESAIAGGIGCSVYLDDELSGVSSLFSESQSRVVLTVAEDDIDVLLEVLGRHEVPWAVLGQVGGQRLHIGEKIDIDLDTLRLVYERTLEKLIAGDFQSEEIFEG